MKKAPIVYLLTACLYLLLGETSLRPVIGYIGLGTEAGSGFFQALSMFFLMVAAVTAVHHSDEDEERGGVAWLFPLSTAIVITTATLSFSNLAGVRVWWAPFIFFPSLVLLVICVFAHLGRSIRPHNG